MKRLTKKKALTLVKELDAFPKVPESYVESTASGGTGNSQIHTSQPNVASLSLIHAPARGTGLEGYFGNVAGYSLLVALFEMP